MKVVMNFYVADREKPAYHSLFFGIKYDNVGAVKLALAEGADLNKVYIERWGSSAISFNGPRDEDSIPLLSYVLENNTAEICELINQVLDPTNNNKKIFILSFKDPNGFSEEGLNKYLKSHSINEECIIQDYKKIYLGKSSNIKTTLLHISCYKENVATVEALLREGANPNLLDGNGKTVIEVMRSEGGYKENRLLITELLIANGLDMTNSQVWKDLTEKLQIPQIKRIIKFSDPSQALLAPTFLRIKSNNLFYQWNAKKIKNNENSYESFPLISDIVNFEKRELNIQTINSFCDRDLHKFFKSKSLGKALSGRYKNKSPRLMKYINKFVFQRSSNKEINSHYCELNIEALYALDFIADLFVEHNPSMFLDVVDSVSKKIKLNQQEQLYPRRLIEILSNKEQYKTLLSLLSDNFTDHKIKVLIEEFMFDKKNCYVELDDLVDMYSTHAKEYSELIKNTSFVKIDTFQKLHDVFSAEIEKLEQPLCSLNQQSFFPALKNIENVQFMETYSFKVAETNHELIEWGSSMSHCVGSESYSKDAISGKMILLSLCVDGVPKYCIEITDGKIEQIQGKSRSKPPVKVMSEMNKILKKENVLK